MSDRNSWRNVSYTPAREGLCFRQHCTNDADWEFTYNRVESQYEYVSQLCADHAPIEFVEEPIR